LLVKIYLLREWRGWETYPLDGSAFFLCDADGLSSWWEWGIIVTVFAQQLQELVRMLSDQLRQLWVTSAHLLEDRFEHLGLLLHDLAKLLELGVVAEEVEVTQSTTGCSCGYCSSCSKDISCSSTSGCTASSSTSCGCGLEQIDGLFTTLTTFGSRRSGGWRCGLATSCWGRLSLFLL
jgi:hypothetical protein